MVYLLLYSYKHLLTIFFVPGTMLVNKGMQLQTCLDNQFNDYLSGVMCKVL